MSSPQADQSISVQRTGSGDGRPDFEIGLALAGAISAGAYTAGVIDFLAQALHEWESARSDGAPRHRVRIRTIAGASAGAITGALGVVALKRGLHPVPLTSAERAVLQGEADDPAAGATGFQSIRCVLPSLYEAWVERPRMVADPGSAARDLLGLDDLRPDRARAAPRKRKVVRSLLNADLLDEIASTALRYPGFTGQAAPAAAADPPPFLADEMHVFMTVTNLRGIPFHVGFGPNDEGYGMLTHGDRVHYRVALRDPPPGSVPWAKTRFLEMDKSIAIRAADLPRATGHPVPETWMQYGMTAVASGAFPGGLAPRLITTTFAEYFDRQFPLPNVSCAINPSFPTTYERSAEFAFLAVDGGVVNNSPFDFVEYALWERGEERKTGAGADRAVIMIAPFPEPPTFLAAGQPQDEIGSVVRALFPTLLNQARFRASELGAALDEKDLSRFLISPRRSLAAGPKERYPIACGLLGGFGGFLDEQFRAHDYQLGRRNCQNFLKTTFRLPAKATAQDGGPGKAIGPVAEGDHPAGDIPIIPLVGEAAREVGLLPWPQMSGSNFQTLMRRIARRFGSLRGPLVDAQVKKAEIRFALRLVLFLSRRRILNFIELTILADLVRRNQITGWDLPPSLDRFIDQRRVGRQTDDVRMILASLVGPARTAATVRDLVTMTHLEATFIEQVLGELRQLPAAAPHRVVRESDGTYRLQMHVPVGIRALPAVGSWIERFFPQTYRYA